ncbi:class E sortase [Streptomyces sp. NPDC047315]|uniref:class E sortase n=1 Tax=Streptomyces sp. NPDC047315 TaxID=3155142 RepID=UPI0033C0E56F
MRRRPERRERLPVVVQGRGRRRRARVAGALWVGAEAAVTFGVVVLLLVVHQLWWTNRQAKAGAERAVTALEREWDEAGPGAAGAPGVPDASGTPEEPDASAGSAGSSGAGASRVSPGGDGGGGDGGAGADAGRTPRWDRAYAVIRIPRLGVTAPVAEGVAKRGVLDKGYVGQYPGTARPGQPGNLALAGHRNTHGEPFRYVNRLRPGDDVRIETRDAVYVYEVDKTLPRTSPGDVGVIRPVPRSLVRPGVGYAEPGRYLTLTTCTPEFSSKYRLIVWGKLRVVERR